MEIRQTITIIGKKRPVKLSRERIFKNRPFLAFRHPEDGCVYELDRAAAVKFLEGLDAFGDDCSPKCNEFRETIRAALGK